ncbi:MAG TPA: hypothetical protein VG518_05145 [Solirubrobacterales bacterium]|nr:hypothetical protein [Solirubrobacterales bacterium]
MSVRSQARELGSRRAAVVLLAAGVIAAGALLLALDSHLTFIADDWMLLVKRRGWTADYFLHPFHGNIVLAPAALYKLMRELFGTASALPYYVLAVLVFLASVVLLFVYLRRRVGDWLALFAALLIAFLGAAFEDLLFAFQVGYFGSVAAGLGMLIALDREDDRGDRMACALLVVSVSFSSVGLAFIAGALADLAWGRRPWLRRAYVAFVPIALYALWWAGWGHEASQHLSLHNLLHTPSYVFDAAGAGMTSLAGLATGDGSEPEQPHLIWGKALLVLGLGLAVFRSYRNDWKVSRGLAIALFLALALWVLTGLNRDETRPPTSSRFQYASAVFLLLVFGEALRGIRVRRPAVAIAGLATVLALWGGISLLEREYSERWKPATEALRGTLAAVEIAGRSGNPRAPVFFPPDIRVPAGAYLAVVDDYGSPAYGEARLAAMPEPDRESADLSIAQALGLKITSARPAERTLGCQLVRASSEGFTGVTLLHGGFTLANLGEAPIELMLSRFADEFAVFFGPLAPGLKVALRIPTDESERPWNLGLRGTGRVRLCTTEPAA